MAPLSQFESIVFFTGAGMSAESLTRIGKTLPEKTESGQHLRREDFASQEAFYRDPERVWEAFESLRAEAVASQPHEGHYCLAALQASRPGIHIVTQNTDGLHQRAGARSVCELHGSLLRVRCDACGVLEEAHLSQPRKHICGRYWRPDLVWAGDALPQPALDQALEAIRKCQLLVSVGTKRPAYQNFTTARFEAPPQRCCRCCCKASTPRRNAGCFATPARSCAVAN